MTIAYRRSEALVPAFAYEYELAKSDGVRFEWCARPVRILGEGGRVTGVVFQRTELDEPATRSSPVRRSSGIRVRSSRRHGGEGAGTGASARPGLGRARACKSKRARSSSTARL